MGPEEGDTPLLLLALNGTVDAMWETMSAKVNDLSAALVRLHALKTGDRHTDWRGFSHRP